MKSIFFKISLLTLFLVAISSSCLTAFAQVTPGSTVNEAEILNSWPDVYVKDLVLEKTDYKAGDTVKGSFTLTNAKDIAVSNLSYSAFLMGDLQENGLYKYKFDNKVIGTVFLDKNETKNIKFEYTLPLSSSAYTLNKQLGIKIQAFSGSGFSLGSIKSKVKILDSGIMAVGVSSSSVNVANRSFELNEGPMVYKDDNVSLKLSLNNDSIQDINGLTPKISIYEMDFARKPLSTYSEKEFSLKAKSKADFNFDLPTFNYTPKVYAGEFVLVDKDGLNRTAPIQFRYIVYGEVVNIQNVVTNSSIVKKGGEINLKISYSGTPQDILNNQAATSTPLDFSVKLSNENNELVAKYIGQSVFKTLGIKDIKLTASTTSKVLKIEIVVSKEGKIITEYKTELVSKVEEKSYSQFMIWGFAIVFIIIVLLILKLKKKKITPTFILLILIITSGFLVNIVRGENRTTFNYTDCHIQSGITDFGHAVYVCPDWLYNTGYYYGSMIVGAPPTRVIHLNGDYLLIVPNIFIAYFLPGEPMWLVGTIENPVTNTHPSNLKVAVNMRTISNQLPYQYFMSNTWDNGGWTYYSATPDAESDFFVTTFAPTFTGENYYVYIEFQSGATTSPPVYQGGISLQINVQPFDSGNPPPTEIDGSCGPAASSTYLSTNTTYFGALCAAGSPTPISPTFPVAGGSSSWTCSGINGGFPSETCIATRAAVAQAVNGSCGTATTTATTTIPTLNLCLTGTSTTPINNGATWNWSCNGTGGGSPASCSATIPAQNGACGTNAQGKPFATAPAQNILCNYNSVTPINVSEGSRNWTWSCFGSNGGIVASCFAPVVKPGTCGSAATQTENAPTDNLCVYTSLTPTVVPAGSPVASWSWVCSGKGTGAVSPTCVATKITPNPILNCTVKMTNPNTTNPVNVNVNTTWTATSTTGLDLSNYILKWRVIDANYPNPVAATGTNPWNNTFTTVGKKTVGVTIYSSNLLSKGVECPADVSIVQEGGQLREI